MVFYHPRVDLGAVLEWQSHGFGAKKHGFELYLYHCKVFSPWVNFLTPQHLDVLFYTEGIKVSSLLRLS